MISTVSIGMANDGHLLIYVQGVNSNEVQGVSENQRSARGTESNRVAEGAGFGGDRRNDTIVSGETWNHDENGTLTIYMTEVIINEETDQSGESGRGSSGGGVPRGTEAGNTPGSNQPDLQPVREAGTGSEVQRVPERDTRHDPVQGAGVQEVPAEVTTEERNIAEKAELNPPSEQAKNTANKNSISDLPKTECKTKREVDRAFQINFSGTVIADRYVSLSNADKKAIASAIKSGNAQLDDDGDRGSVTPALTAIFLTRSAMEMYL